MNNRHGWVYVYLIESTSGHFKIGVSDDPERRLKELKKTQGPYDYSLLSFVPTRDREDALRLERGLHADFENRHTNGEWFELTAKDLLDLGAIFEVRRQNWTRYAL